jgi:hypothetical protein
VGSASSLTALLFTFISIADYSMERSKTNMIKIISTLTGINILAFVVVGIYFLMSTSGRNVDSLEKGWMMILAILSVMVILLGIIPVRISQTPLSIFISMFFAALPSIIALGIYLNDNLPSFKKKKTMAEVYFKDKTQRSIAAAIEKNDTIAFKELIKGQNLNIQGNKVNDWDGLNYLQFAVRLRTSAQLKPDGKNNDQIIRLLVQQGYPTTPALAEAIKYLPPDLIVLLLNAGADPSTQGYANSDPLLFEAIGTEKLQNDIAILLIKRGADVNAKNADKLTSVMFSAQNAGTSSRWNDTWRVIRYMLEESHADYKYTLDDGRNLDAILQTIKTNAEAEKIPMAPDFYSIIEWLKPRVNK